MNKREHNFVMNDNKERRKFWTGVKDDIANERKELLELQKDIYDRDMQNSYSFYGVKQKGNYATATMLTTIGFAYYGMFEIVKKCVFKK